MHEEDLVIGSGAGQAVVMHGVGVAHDLIHELAAADRRVGGAHHVAAHVATSCERVHASAVDGPHGGLHVPLHDAMQLPRLARRDLERAIRVLPASVIHGQPLLGGAIPCWKPHADHEAEGILDAELLPLLPEIAVILLVAAMRLDQLRIMERNLAGCDVIQGHLQGSPKLLGLGLDHLVRLHWPVILASRGGCLVHAKSGVELVLPLPEACVVLVHVLIVTVPCGDEALRSEPLQNLVKVPGRLGEVNP
mmetsp:Transcript_28861/g.72881  ORF Transcript_28861/g.72881 Transcript_28861/m.72881 type:complete len:250 (-) Transcript_28861:1519-2268(-)